MTFKVVLVGKGTDQKIVVGWGNHKYFGEQPKSNERFQLTDTDVEDFLAAADDRPFTEIERLLAAQRQTHPWRARLLAFQLDWLRKVTSEHQDN